jgi:hypothetical protein
LEKSSTSSLNKCTGDWSTMTTVKVVLLAILDAGFRHLQWNALGSL